VDEISISSGIWVQRKKDIAGGRERREYLAGTRFAHSSHAGGTLEDRQSLYDTQFCVLQGQQPRRQWSDRCG
jgi:hypothetical protein